MAGAPWQSYDSVAREYDRAWHPSFGPVARDLLELVALEPHEAMLDVGTGKVAEEMQRQMHPLDGIDPNDFAKRFQRADRPGQCLADGARNLDCQKDAPAFALIRHARRP